MKDYKKAEFEKITSENFLECYNKINKTNIQILKGGEPDRKEPDIICSDGYSIEITTIYDKKMQSNRKDEEIEGIKNEYHNARLLLNPKEEIENAIFKKLKKLNKGLYSNTDSSKIILVCYCLGPLFNTSEAEFIQTNYYPFKQGSNFREYFSEIWLLWHEGNSGYKILKLE
jgi:hypothetical protein